MDVRKYNAAEGGLMDVEPKRRDPKKAHLHKVEVERGHKKGYIVRHIEHRHDDGHMEHDHPNRDAKFPIADQKELMQHMQDHMGEESQEVAGGGGEEEQDQQQQ